MELKEYQQRALEQVRLYLEKLAEWRDKADAHPDLEIDYPTQAWNKTGIMRGYVPRKNGLQEPLPTFCLKIPTGGGKTLLAVKTVDLVNTTYRRKQTGLVLWIVPTTQIYRQTLKGLRDREHPYRQHLDLASGGRTVILEKTERFAPHEVTENLVVLMLMLPSANRETKETLRMFQDNGGFQDFFPPEDDIEAQNKLLKEYPNLDCYEEKGGYWGCQIKTSLGNTLRLLRPLIILDEGHKAYSENAQATLRGFNPLIIVELSATPPSQSNKLVDISGRDLHREDMIKLDLHLINKKSHDWKDTLLASVAKRNALEEKAREYESNTGIHVRPICLIQVERTGKDQRDGKMIHSEDAREHLIKIIGIPPEEVAVKTSEKDELREVDDLGGLMARDCRIRYIITKQALQEGWDCAFAYVLTILTNPSSKNALTQLVGRILRQPYAKKTGVQELDESYVFSFRQKAGALMESVKTGFEQEGLGDLKGRVVASDDEDDGPAVVRETRVRPQFAAAAKEAVLPVFMIRDGAHWKPVGYESDIVSRLQWSEVELAPLLALTLGIGADDDKDQEHIATLSDDAREVVKRKGAVKLEAAALKVDPVFMTRQLLDIVPNPWTAYDFAERVLNHHFEHHGREQVEHNFVYLIEQTRQYLEGEKNRLAEKVFRGLLAEKKLRFLIIGKEFGYKLPEKITITREVKTLNRKDGMPLEKSLLDFMAEDEYNETEQSVAWYLEGQERLFFWYRNRSRHDYGIQGWRKHRVYPDFIFTVTEKEKPTTFQTAYVLETKGLHLEGSSDTDYKRKLFDLCTRQAKGRRLDEVAPPIGEKILRFEVLSEQEWERKLAEVMQGEK